MISKRDKAGRVIVWLDQRQHVVADETRPPRIPAPPPKGIMRFVMPYLVPRPEITEWLAETGITAYHVQEDALYIAFEHDREAAMFKLRWG